MMKIDIRYFLLALFLCLEGGNPLMAQDKIIEINVVSKDANSTTDSTSHVSNAAIFGFRDLPSAVKFQKQLNDLLSGFVPKQNDADVYVLTDAQGYAEVELPLDGVLVVQDPGGSEAVLKRIDGRMKVKVVLQTDGKLMKEVPVTVNRKRANTPRPMRRVGNRIVIGPQVFYLPGDDIKSNCRVGLAPIATCLESFDTITGRIDTIEVIRPFVKDGEAYRRSQDRRMGYDMPLQDKLAQFTSDTFLKEHQEDSIIIYHVLYPVDIRKHYKVDATLWFEDYNRIYRSDSVCLSEGFDQEPMRFLEFDMMTLPIQDREEYVRKGRRERRNDKQYLNLNFVVGKAKLLESDSLNFVQLERLRNKMSVYYNDATTTITKGFIRGKASPEGGIELNRALSLKRARYLREMISNSFPGSGITYHEDATVATWAEVADSLEADSLWDYANQVRACNERESKIRKLPFYGYIKDTILPRLRVVEFEYEYVTNRVKTTEEILRSYDVDPGYRDGSKGQDYEFYTLFKHKKKLQNNPSALEPLAAAAYERVRDLGADRPWPLAAYHLATCYLQRGHVDTLLLKPYLSWNMPPNYAPKDVNQQSQGVWNDEAIVCAHIAMLCKAGDYVMADSIAVNLLPDDPKFKRLRLFLDCLNERWNVPEVRDSIAATSALNKVVVYAAQDAEGEDNTIFHQAALSLAKDSTKLNQRDPRVKYLQAILRFRLDCPIKDNIKKFPESRFYKSEIWEDEDPDDPEVRERDWGYPMVECALLDESFVRILQYDGYFNKAYRESFNAYWKKLKARRAKAAERTHHTK